LSFTTMPNTRSAKPVAKPAARRRASPRKSSAKKSARKRAAEKSAPKKKSAKPKSRRALKRKRDAAVRKRAVKKRKQTLAATRVDVGPEPVAVDPLDEVARAAVARRQGRGRTAVDRVNDPPPATGIALVERVTRAVERELSQIEVIVGGHHVKPEQRTEAERRARTLASLARTLTEVRKLRADEHRVKPQDDPDRPRDLEELRRRLAERLKNMVRGTVDHPTGKPETGGDGLPD
jgi:hypothetical protein